MTLPDLSTMAQVVIAISVVTGLGLGGWQLARLHGRHRDAFALELVRMLQEEPTAYAVQAVLELPDEVSEEQLTLRGPEAVAAVTLVEYTFDTIGWMVHRRIIPLRDLDDLMGGAVRAVWRRVHRLAEERREARGSATDFEWTQWLAERLEANGSPAKHVGAYNYYRRWRP